MLGYLAKTARQIVKFLETIHENIDSFMRYMIRYGYKKGETPCVEKIMLQSSIKETGCMGKNKKRSKLGVACALAGAAAAGVAAGIAMYQRNRTEQVYHEAELKAMDELDDMNAENESACEGCECAEECAAGAEECEPVAEQMEISEEESEAAPEKAPNAEEAADETTPIAEPEEEETPAETEENAAEPTEE